jgi:VanZ family protein
VHDLKAIRLFFALTLALTLLSLLTPGDLVLAFKNWVYSWIPFAQQLDDANVSHNGDKVVHACLFASLGYLAIKGWVLRSQLAWVLAGLVWLAPQTEWAQSYIPGRGASLADVAADVAGLALGVGWALCRQRRRTRRIALGSQKQPSAVQNCA